MCAPPCTPACVAWHHRTYQVTHPHAHTRKAHARTHAAVLMPACSCMRVRACVRAGACVQALTPEWEKAAKGARGIVNIAAIDADAHKELASEYGIQVWCGGVVCCRAVR